MDVITSRVEYRSSAFIKTVFEATFSFSNILYITQATLNQIDNIKSFTSDMRFDVVGLTCRMKSVIAATAKPFLALLSSNSLYVYFCIFNIILRF